ncbi:hypothetical protein E3T40_09355 [Cryobacterium sp. TMT1-19]|uniref:hypothetical protein n=1 Tax=Cryobacterium sp. TMT1-19 TaxID=1259231 RepID=UPI0010693FAE|nr:hypothetical protein [Cryobacterium sp. TMT1-19]TFD34817.1 hypothetical protein E3T40_09355 [Cryobacterium sp. TMT1-19]
MALLRTLDEVVAVVRAVELERTRQATDAGSRTLVGLAGASGSGKSTVGEALVARLNAGASWWWRATTCCTARAAGPKPGRCST